MSSPPQIRRADRMMPPEKTRDALRLAYCGRLATVGKDGAPYCVPLLYVFMDDTIFVHNTAARGHLRENVDHDERVCFEIDDAGRVFNYGRFECDSALEYSSVIVFGRIRVAHDKDTKQRFCEALMAKYGRDNAARPQNFFPRLDHITVYAIAIERITGKEMALPDVSQQWPAVDRTKSPKAEPPPA